MRAYARTRGRVVMASVAAAAAAAIVVSLAMGLV